MKKLGLLFVSGTMWLVAIAAPVAAYDYDGQDPNAPWRATAAQQIDLLRKADINLNVQFSNGDPVPGAQVQVAMQRHEFKFGSAVDPRYFLTSQPSYFNQTYANKVVELFNTVTLENHLKWKAWDGEFSSSFDPPVTQEGLDWLNARNIAVRGHNLIWPGIGHLPSAVEAILALPNPTNADKQALYDATFNHINDIVPAVAGKVFLWDVLNEPRGNHAIEDMLVGFTPTGKPTITDVADLRARWFNAAKAADPGAAAFINEFGILPGDTDSLAEGRRATYQSQIQAILAAGGTLEGMGFESHFEDGLVNKQITGIPKLWSVLDSFQTQFGLPMQITEFDYSTTNQTLQAEYTRDFMTAVFAHPGIEAFVTWGFWEGKMANSLGAFYDSNWNLKPNGQAYLDLVFNDWWTNANGNTDATGAYSLRGFKGDYQIVVDYNGHQYSYDASLSNGGLSMTLVVPGGSTNFLGGDILTPANWDNGLPDLTTNPGTITVSGQASNQVTGFHITQTGGTIDFTNTQAFRSSLEGGTQWHLQGGVITDSNSGMRINDSTLFIEGGAVVLDATRNINFVKGTARIELVAGSLTAKDLQFSTIAASTAGSKVVEFGIGDGVMTLLTTGSPFIFGNDGDPQNDYINFVTGTDGSLITNANIAYFEQLWNAGTLRIDDLTGAAMGLTFSQTRFSVLSNGNGTTTLMLLQIPGDFNKDGNVNALDLSIWQTAFGVSAAGDADGDGDSDSADFLIWQRNYQNGGAMTSAAMAVPEPGGLWLISLALGLAGARRSPRGQQKQERFVR